jgi:L-asparaginase II
MALAFARLGAAARGGVHLPARVARVMAGRPFLVGGTDRFDTVLMEEAGGAVIAKVGAEGVHSVAVPGEGIGLALKVEDGGTRAQHPAVLRLLQHLGVLGPSLPARLAAFLEAPALNTRGDEVGVTRPAR